MTPSVTPRPSQPVIAGLAVWCALLAFCASVGWVAGSKLAAKRWGS